MHNGTLPQRRRPIWFSSNDPVHGPVSTLCFSTHAGHHTDSQSPCLPPPCLPTLACQDPTSQRALTLVITLPPSSHMCRHPACQLMLAMTLLPNSCRTKHCLPSSTHAGHDLGHKVGGGAGGAALQNGRLRQQGSRQIESGLGSFGHSGGTWQQRRPPGWRRERGSTWMHDWHVWHVPCNKQKLWLAAAPYKKQAIPRWRAQ